MKGVDKALKSTQSQLKDVNKLLKLDPTNTELLRQKQKLLGDQVTQTRERLDKLKEAQKQMDASGIDKNSAAYQALQREIIETEHALQEAEKASKQFNVTLEKVSAGALKVSEATAKAAEKTKALSAAAAGALTGIVGMAYKAATLSDDLNTLSKQTGFTTAELQKMQYAAGRIDVEMETIVAASTKLTKQLGSNEKKFNDIGIATRDASDQLRSSTDVLYDMLEYLSHIENETERDAVAMDFFGKSANDLAGIVDDGGAALKEFGDEAERAGLILDQETLDGLNAVNDEIDKLKAQGMATIAKAGASALQALAPVIEKVAGAIEKVLLFISQLSPQQIQVIMTILTVIAALSPLLSIISKISIAISVLAPLLTFLVSPIGLVIAAIAALVAVGVLLYKNWDTIKAKAVEFWEGIKQGFELTKQDVVNAVEAMKTGLSNAWESIKSTAVNVWNGIKNAIVTPIQNAWDTATGIIDKIKGMFDFSLSFPHIKLPHFNWTWSDLGLLRVPHISVEWYKKAYDQPYMFSSPTVVGNRGFGDGNGAEMVYGRDNLMRDISEAMAQGFGDQPIVITVQSILDGRIVGQSSARYQRNTARALG